MTQPPICDYEGSDYQSSFWDRGERQYEDRAEAIALRRLLPRYGHLLLELGAGAGRNTARYTGFERIVLVDYSVSQLQEAQRRLGTPSRFVFVAADIYRLPFVEARFDAATMIRTLHHMTDAPRALAQVRSALAPGAAFILEFANKLNTKSILRYWLGRQAWSPFTREPVEFAPLNFDFHPAAVRGWLNALGFRLEKILTVSHFRAGILKRTVPLALLVFFDSLLQWSGAVWQLTPSVFVKALLPGKAQDFSIGDVSVLFKCPQCGHSPLLEREKRIECPACGRSYRHENAIYDFRQDAANNKERL